MVDRSEHEQRLWEAMESCRGDIDELTDPLFADLAARLAKEPELRMELHRLQQADRSIRLAFGAVPIPVGLADCVSRRLSEVAWTAASATEPHGSDSVAPAVSKSGLPVLRLEADRRASRRRLLAGFAAMAAAVILLSAVCIQAYRPRHDTPASVLEKSMEFFGKDDQPLGDLVARKPPPADLPMSRDIVPLPEIRWRYVDRFPGGRAVAYDLPTAGRERATLYVMDRNVAGLPSIPPVRPLSTGGKSAAAWQVGNTLYVLVVEGDAGMYASYLDRSHGPLT